MKYYCCLFILITGLFVNCNCGYNEQEIVQQEQPNSQQPNSTQPNSQQPNSQQPNSQQPNSQQPNSQQPNSQQPNSQQPNSQQPNSQQPKKDSDKLAAILSQDFQLEYAEEAIVGNSVIFPMKPPVFPTLQEKGSITEFVKELKNLFKNAKSTDKTVGKEATAELCKKYNEIIKACIVKNACRCRIHMGKPISNLLLERSMSLENLQLILINKILNDLCTQQGFVFEKSTKTNLIISAKNDKKEFVFSLQKDVTAKTLLEELDTINVYKKMKNNFIDNTPELKERNWDWQVCLLPVYKKTTYTHFTTIHTQLSDFLDN